MKTEFEHFYWVSQAYNGQPGERAWHVQAIDKAETMEEVAAMGGNASSGRVLNMVQAAAEGFTLEMVGAMFSQEAAVEADRLHGELEAAKREIERLLQESEGLSGALDTAGAEIARLSTALEDAKAAQ